MLARNGVHAGAVGFGLPCACCKGTDDNGQKRRIKQNWAAFVDWVRRARSGGHHWLTHRATAVANVFLALWLFISILMLPNFQL